MRLQNIFNNNLIITLEELKSDSELVRQIEIRLSDLMLLDVSEIDGVWKDKTEQALNDFLDLAFLNNGTTGLFGRTFAKKLIEMPTPISKPRKPDSTKLNLEGSVGRGGTNSTDDVLAVKSRLSDLGFSWLSKDATINQETIQTIELFQAIITGRTIVSGVDGRVDVGGKTQRYLESKNAPLWQEMPSGSSEDGFVNHDNHQGDTHDFGTSWLIEVIQEAAKIYLTDYRNAKPMAALMATNNLSIFRGGKSPHHATHQTGLSCDILLPRKDGTFGDTRFQESRYDRDAMEAMLRAIHKQSKGKIKRIFFNDLVLVAKGLCQNLNDNGIHDNHAHIDIEPLQV